MDSKSLVGDDKIILKPSIGQVIAISLETKQDLSKYFIITDIIREGQEVSMRRMKRWFGSTMENEAWVDNFRSSWPFDRLLLLSVSHPYYFIIPNSQTSIKEHFMLKVNAAHLKKLYE